MTKVLVRRILAGTTRVLAAAGSLLAQKPDPGPGAIVFLRDPAAGVDGADGSNLQLVKSWKAPEPCTMSPRLEPATNSR